MTAFDSTCVSSFPQLLKYMLDKGVPCSKELIADGRIHRYSASEGRDKSEWYAIFDFEDGHYFATFGSWKDSLDFKHEFRSWKEDFDPFYFDHVLKCQAETKQRLEAEQKGAIVKAQEAFTSCSIAESHPYLDRKKVGAHGLKIRGGELLVPVYNSSNELITFQRIFPDGSKYFFPGAPSSLGRLVLGGLDKAKRVLVAEGYATGASIHECTGECVVIAFSASNCPKVGLELSLKHKGKKFFLAGDLGADKCILEWKDRVSDEVLLPDMKGKEGKDWNDVHVQLGKEEVRKQITIVEPLVGLNYIEICQSDFPDPTFIVHNLFVDNSLNMIYSDSGVGKSRFAYELAFCLANEMDFLTKKTVQKRVCYIDGELSGTEIKDRIKDLVSRYQDHEKGEHINPDNLIFMSEEFNAETKVNLFSPQCLERIAVTMEDFDVLFLDTYTSLSSFEELEDHYKEQVLWLHLEKPLKTLQRQGKTIFLIHHTNKNKGVRGTGLLEKNMSTVLRLERPEESDCTYNAALEFQVFFKKWRGIKDKDVYPVQATLFSRSDWVQGNPQFAKMNGWQVKLIKSK